jgi:hypothetical protein
MEYRNIEIDREISRSLSIYEKVYENIVIVIDFGIPNIAQPLYLLWDNQSKNRRTSKHNKEETAKVTSDLAMLFNHFIICYINFVTTEVEVILC